MKPGDVIVGVLVLLVPVGTLTAAAWVLWHAYERWESRGK